MIQCIIVQKNRPPILKKIGGRPDIKMLLAK